MDSLKMLVKIDGDDIIFPYTLYQLREDNPRTSFPRELSDELLEDFGVFQVERAPLPPHNPLTQTLSQKVERNEEGELVHVYEVSDLELGEAEGRVLQYRDNCIEETNKYALQDVVLSDEMRDYRQKLREIESQEGYPLDVVWPTRPKE
jgi:hypothetical protein